MLYRQQEIQHIFILKSLQSLKINKYRNKITEKIISQEKRIKWFLFWPIINIYEYYENWQENRNRNTKS